MYIYIYVYIYIYINIYGASQKRQVPRARIRATGLCVCVCVYCINPSAKARPLLSRRAKLLRANSRSADARANCEHRQKNAARTLATTTCQKSVCQSERKGGGEERASEHNLRRERVVAQRLGVCSVYELVRRDR